MKRIFLYCSIFIMVQNIVLGQIKRDPRSVAMANAYGTIADGFFAVGYNPAMLAYQQDKPFMLQLFGVDMGIGVILSHCKILIPSVKIRSMRLVKTQKTRMMIVRIDFFESLMMLADWPFGKIFICQCQ